LNGVKDFIKVSDNNMRQVNAVEVNFDRGDGKHSEIAGTI